MRQWWDLTKRRIKAKGAAQRTVQLLTGLQPGLVHDWNTHADRKLVLFARRFTGHKHHGWSDRQVIAKIATQLAYHALKTTFLLCNKEVHGEEENRVSCSKCKYSLHQQEPMGTSRGENNPTGTLTHKQVRTGRETYRTQGKN